MANMQLFLNPSDVGKAMIFKLSLLLLSQLAITCSKLTIETLKQSVKYVQS